MDTVLRLPLGDKTAISVYSSEPRERLAVCRGKGRTLFFIYLYYFFCKNLSIDSARDWNSKPFAPKNSALSHHRRLTFQNWSRSCNSFLKEVLFMIKDQILFFILFHFYFMFALLFYLSRKSHSLVFLGSIFSAIRETRGSLDGSVHW